MQSTSSDGMLRSMSYLCFLADGNKVYSAEEMAALGAPLGCLLAITLVLLGLISYKHYIHPMKHKHGEDHSKVSEPLPYIYCGEISRQVFIAVWDLRLFSAISLLWYYNGNWTMISALAKIS